MAINIFSVIPGVYENTGTQPGVGSRLFVTGEKPTAAKFNYYFNAFYKCIADLVTAIKATINNSDNEIPTSKAVYDALALKFNAGNVSSTYDTAKKIEDILSPIAGNTYLKTIGVDPALISYAAPEVLTSTLVETNMFEVFVVDAITTKTLDTYIATVGTSLVIDCVTVDFTLTWDVTNKILSGQRSADVNPDVTLFIKMYEHYNT